MSQDTQQTQMPTSQFIALLNPLKDLASNFNIELSQCLEEYLKSLETIVEQEMNFAEAALLLQSSASIYSRKVDYLWVLLLDLVESLGKQSKKKSDDNEEEGSEENAAARKKRRRKNDLCLDFKLIEDFGNTEKNTELTDARRERLKPVKFLPRRNPEMEAASTRNARYARKIQILGRRGDQIGYKKDFCLNWPINTYYMLSMELPLHIETNDLSFMNVSIESCTNEIDERSHLRSPMDAAEFPQETQNPTLHPEGAMPPSSPAMDNDMSRDHSPLPPENTDFTDHIELSGQTHIDACCPNRREQADLANVHSIPAPENKKDPWEVIDPANDKSIDRPIKLRKHTKLPLSIINNENGQTELPIHNGINSHLKMQILALKKKPKRIKIDYSAIANDPIARKIAQEFDCDFLGFKDSEPIYSDDEDLLGFPDPLSIADIPSSDLLEGFEDDMMDNDHHDNDFDNELLPLEEGELPPLPLPTTVLEGLNADVIAEHREKDHLKNFALNRIQEIRNQAREDALKSDLTRRVEAWHDFLRPRIEESEQRRNFDIHEYGTQLLDSFESDTPGIEISFQEIMKDKIREDIPRFFLSSLLLANTYNIEILKTSEDDLATDCVKLRLLSSSRQHDRLAEYAAPSQVQQKPKKRPEKSQPRPKPPPQDQTKTTNNKRPSSSRGTSESSSGFESDGDHNFTNENKKKKFKKR